MKTIPASLDFVSEIQGSQTINNAHYDCVIMTTIASQITSLTVVYSIVYSDADQRKHQSSAPLAFVWGIHRGPVKSPHKWPVTRKMFPFDDVIMDIWLVFLLGEMDNNNGLSPKDCIIFRWPYGWFVENIPCEITLHLPPWCRIYASVNRLSSGSDNGLSPIRRQAIIYTNAGLLLTRPLATNFNETLIKIPNLSLTKLHLKRSSGKWRPFCPGRDELSECHVTPWMQLWQAKIGWSNCWCCQTTSSSFPLNTWRNNNVVITSKRRHFDVITSKWRRFDVITTSLLRDVSTGLKQHWPWISNYMHYKPWVEITYPFPNFNGCTEWISNFTPHFTWHVITYPWWD